MSGRGRKSGRYAFVLPANVLNFSNGAAKSFYYQKLINKNASESFSLTRLRSNEIEKIPVRKRGRKKHEHTMIAIRCEMF